MHKTMDRQSKTHHHRSRGKTRRAQRRLVSATAILVALASCLSDESTSRLTENSETSGAEGEPGSVTEAVDPPPGEIIDTQPTSGWTEGSFSVSHAGAAGYHLPLWVPDGRRGMQPELAIHYNSSGGNGLLGVGWALSGLSSIRPCPRTLAHDGTNENISFLGTDAYCLDGQRLRPATSAPPGEQEYRTERDTFTTPQSNTLAPPILSAFATTGSRGWPT